MKASRPKCLVLVLVTMFSVSLFSISLGGQTTANPANLPQRDGSHDFDFLIGDWKAHVRRLPDRLNNSNVWVEYGGMSNHHKILEAIQTLKNSTSPVLTRSCVSKPTRFACITPQRGSGAFSSWMLMKGLLTRLMWWVALAETAASFTIRTNTRAAHSGALCLAQHLSEICAHGAVVLSRRRKDLGGQLDL